MRGWLYQFNASVRTVSSLGLIMLLGVIFIQLLQAEALAKTGGSRDEFPGRRQGGGTHLTLPVSDLAL